MVPIIGIVLTFLTFRVDSYSETYLIILFFSILLSIVPCKVVIKNFKNYYLLQKLKVSGIEVKATISNWIDSWYVIAGQKWYIIVCNYNWEVFKSERIFDTRTYDVERDQTIWVLLDTTTKEYIVLWEDFLDNI